MASNYRIVERLERYCKNSGLFTKKHYAQTGTCYVTITDEDKELKIRIADHQDVHCNDDYSIDEIEGTFEGAISLIEEFFNIKIKRRQRKTKWMNADFYNEATGQILINKVDNCYPARRLTAKPWVLMYYKNKTWHNVFKGDK